MNSLKRKQSPDDVDDALPIASTPTRRDHKRRRCTGLERGLAGLTLSMSSSSAVHTPASTPSPSPESAFAQYSNHPPYASEYLAYQQQPAPAPGPSFVYPAPPGPVHAPAQERNVYGSAYAHAPVSVAMSAPVAGFAAVPAAAAPAPVQVLRPSAVESPPDEEGVGVGWPEVADVKMGASSWYEPERDRECFGSTGSGGERLTWLCGVARAGIVVTDLDAASDEEEEEEDNRYGESGRRNGGGGGEDVISIVSPAVLERLRETGAGGARLFGARVGAGAGAEASVVEALRREHGVWADAGKAVVLFRGSARARGGAGARGGLEDAGAAEAEARWAGEVVDGGGIVEDVEEDGLVGGAAGWTLPQDGGVAGYYAGADADLDLDVDVDVDMDAMDVEL